MLQRFQTRASNTVQNPYKTFFRFPVVAVMRHLGRESWIATRFEVCYRFRNYVLQSFRICESE